MLKWHNNLEKYTLLYNTKNDELIDYYDTINLS
jgi:hypothetical protein